jgi:hypothetical protein
MTQSCPIRTPTPPVTWETEKPKEPGVNVGLNLAGVYQPERFGGIPLKKIILAAAIAAVASMSVASFASAGIFGYTPPQPVTSTLTAATLYNGVTYNHTYTITMNPITHTFTGVAAPGDIVPGETVQGVLIGNFITIFGQYPADANDPGYTWSYIGSLQGFGLGHDSHDLKWTISFKNS